MRRKIKKQNPGIANQSQPTAFEIMMNVQCGLRAEAGLAPLPHWTQTKETPPWAEKIYRKLRNTILKPILKLKPIRRKVNWRNYGRCVGMMERFKTFLTKEAPDILKKEGLVKISKKRWEQIQPRLGEEQMREYYLKTLGRPADDKATLVEMYLQVLEKQMVSFEKQKQIAFYHLANQSVKTTAIFLKGMGEGYTIFMNEEGQLRGDDRRANIHLELLAWQHDIEKMRRSVIPKNSNHLIAELKKLNEFKNKSHDWFKDVFKDIKLPIGQPGRPPKFA
jgi:hypothetical protein